MTEDQYERLARLIKETAEETQEELTEQLGAKIDSAIGSLRNEMKEGFAALNTVELPLALIALGDIAGITDEGRAQWVKLANRFFGGLERRLEFGHAVVETGPHEIGGGGLRIDAVIAERAQRARQRRIVGHHGAAFPGGQRFARVETEATHPSNADG